MAAKKCAICGKSSGIYPLCNDCFKLRDEGKVEKCPRCGIWHKIEDPCECKSDTSETAKEYICKCCGNLSNQKPLCPTCKNLIDEGQIEKCEFCKKWHLPNIICKEQLDSYKEIIEKQNIQINQITEDAKSLQKELEESESDCITGCGNKANNGYHFCTDCWKQYKNKVLIIKSTKCIEFTLMDEYYDGLYICKDGHIVKSQAEREIDNYLYEHNIKHAYEKAYPIDNNENHDLHPDFYIEKFEQKQRDGKTKIIRNIYIEHWGFSNENTDYAKKRAYKDEIYRNDITIEDKTFIYTEITDTKDMISTLDRKFKFLQEHQIN